MRVYYDSLVQVSQIQAEQVAQCPSALLTSLKQTETHYWARHYYQLSANRGSKAREIKEYFDFLYYRILVYFAIFEPLQPHVNSKELG